MSCSLLASPKPWEHLWASVPSSRAEPCGPAARSPGAICGPGLSVSALEAAPADSEHPSLLVSVSVLLFDVHEPTGRAVDGRVLVTGAVGTQLWQKQLECFSSQVDGHVELVFVPRRGQAARPLRHLVSPGLLAAPWLGERPG